MVDAERFGTCLARDDPTSGLQWGCFEGGFALPTCNNTDLFIVNFCCNAYDLCNIDLAALLVIPSSILPTAATSVITMQNSTGMNTSDSGGKVWLLPCISSLFV